MDHLDAELHDLIIHGRVVSMMSNTIPNQVMVIAPNYR